MKIPPMDVAALRSMEQSIARYNEEQAQNAVAQRQQFINQQATNHLTLLRHQEDAATASFLRQIEAIKQVTS